MIGGNTKVILQEINTQSNDIGEHIQSTYTDLIELTGYLDFVGGSVRNMYSGRFQDTTHIFMCDYQKIDVKDRKCRIIYNNEFYDVLLIDDPMGLHCHLEILLKYNEVSNG